ncbi:hypothetical protein BXY66_2860 [Shimia isoporae]|uniref:Uncharacterized protein n=1 Tax=Shimia isoporae TaxID=647720 RepID=A0A4R1N4M5_9RHOB|nr:hypothetical protein [Shimia isoporae]TCL01545.1 hypothetical protein BXY66_2860 [Shimia isoporae]
MKAFLMACVAVIGIAIAAYYGLHAAGFSASDKGSGPAVRLD